MLKLTGFPLPDVGILTLTLLADATKPEQVTREGLDKAADYLEALYSQPMGKYLAGSLAFTTNGGFTQPSWNNEKFQNKRKAYATLVLRGHQQRDLAPILAILDDKGNAGGFHDLVLRGVEGAPPCAFTGAPAYLRVSRDMLPMINGRGVMNFSPMGDSGLPVSDVILLAIHAMPLGCVITQGALLAVESDDPALMFNFVKENLEKNLLFINMARDMGYEKFPNLSSYKTRLIQVLVDSFLEGESRRETHRAPSLNAYHFSNYGANARVTIYALPSSTVDFVRTASHNQYAESWRRIVQRGWTEDKPEADEEKQKAPKFTQRNLFYEDLFDLPENARDFLGTYFLRRPLHKFKRDPRGEYNTFRDADLISWELTALFLKRMMNMEKKRIDQIYDLGTRLADYIQQQDKRKVLQSLYRANGGYREFRVILLRAIQDYARLAPGGSEPLVSFEGFVKIFEEGDGFERLDFNLARDLLLIRIFEVLHQSGYLSSAANDLQIDDESEEANAI